MIITVIINFIFPIYRKVTCSSNYAQSILWYILSKEDALCPRDPHLSVFTSGLGFWTTEYGGSDALWVPKLHCKKSYGVRLVSGYCRAARGPRHRERARVGTLVGSARWAPGWQPASAANSGSKPSWMSSSARPPDDSSTNQPEGPPSCVQSTYGTMKDDNKGLFFNH